MEGESDSREMLFSAKELQRWRWQTGGAPGIEPPEAAIFCLQPDLMRRAQRRYSLKPVKGLFGDCFLLKNKTSRVLLAGGFGLGSPAMAILVEELAAFGARRFLSIGVAGSLQPQLYAGDVVVCESAVRGEGTSAHYLPVSDVVDADQGMMQGICKALSSGGIVAQRGRSWTTDAPFRETQRETFRHRAEGVLCVEMEAAALFAASQSLGAQAAAVFVIADRLLENGWEPPHRLKPVQDNLATVLEAAIPWLAGESE